MTEVICPYCNKVAEYIDSKYYYSNGVSYGMIYLCRSCDAMVGTHKDSEKPLGRLANGELRILRIKCHKLFDPLWKTGKMTRSEAYKYLRDNTGIKHISWTNLEDAKKVISFLSR